MTVDKDTEATVFAQVDANLDSNPKIRKAGPFGRQVFEFVLRRNALRGSNGHVPIAFIDPDYLADILMLTRDDSVTGVTKAVTARLIEIDHVTGLVRIVGWHPSWGRRPKDGKERTKEWRARKKDKHATSHDGVTGGDAGDETSSQVTGGDESDALDQKREDQRSGDTYARARERHPDAGRVARVVWEYALAASAKLREANVSVRPWPLHHGSSHAGWLALLDRVCELLVGHDAKHAESVARNRVDVAVAQAIKTGEGQWFSPLGMFTPNSFATWSELDPSQITRKAPRASTGGSVFDGVDDAVRELEGRTA
jgi:hypothetical protein